MKRRGRADHLLAWTKSAQWRAICRAQARKNLAAWKAKPRCGALARSTGEPCRNPAKAGSTRCRIHGGSTPRDSAGKAGGWHKPTPAITAAKTERKIRDRIRVAGKKAKRVAKMTATEREAYKAWQRDHEPGSAAERERRRGERRQAREFRERLSADPPPPTPEAQALQDQIDELKVELARRQIDRNLGVFG